MGILQFTAQSIGGQGVSGKADPVPDHCPLCHRGISPRSFHAVCKDPVSEKRQVTLVFQCPRAECQELFLAIYIPAGRAQEGHELFTLERCAPLNPEPAVVSPEVTAVSPTFVEVYNQALASEAHQLQQLTGIGLRKALEFLVKDFVISLDSSKKADVEKLMLGPCIERHVSDPNVKRCAKLAAWLGNDETHYVRRWTDKDVSDLKRLIRLTVIWIESVLVTKRYVSEMDPGAS